jgi:transcription elongation factor Elf1
VRELKMVFLCKRCGRELKSAKSIKLGYGPTCYRIIKFHDNPINIQEEIKFLKIEINLLKKVIRELKSNKSISYQTSPIIKIRNQENHLERDVNKGNMKEVIHELKSCFQNCNGDVRSLLKPIDIEPNLIKTSHLAVV